MSTNRLLIIGLTILLAVLIAGGLATDSRSCQRQINPRQVQRDFLNTDALFQQALADLDGPAELTTSRHATTRQIQGVNRALTVLGVPQRAQAPISVDDAAAILRAAVADRWRTDAHRLRIPDCTIPADE